MIRYIFFVGIILGIFACSKEDRLTPSDADRDWYAIPDEPGELNQLRYQIYKDYGCSVFYKDTLGWEFRGFDERGDSIIYWETLKIGYTISGNSKVDYALTNNEERLIAAVEILQEKVLPRLQQGGIMPLAILLVDTVREKSRNDKAWYTQRAMTSLLIGMVIEQREGKYINVEDMTGEDITEWTGRILASMYQEDILMNEEERLEDEFYSILTKAFENYPFKKEYGYYPDKEDWWSDPEYFYPPEQFGFLDFARVFEKNGAFWKVTPTEQQNCEDFITAVLGYTEEEFNQKYSEWNLLKEQYKWMRDLLVEKGIVK